MWFCASTMTRLIGLLVLAILFHVSFGARCHKDVKPKPKPDDSGRTKSPKPEDNSWSREKPDDSGKTKPPVDSVWGRELPEHGCPKGWKKQTFCGRRAHSCYKKINLKGVSETFTFNASNPCAKYHPEAQLSSIHCLEEDNFLRSTYGPATIGMHTDFKTYWSRPKFHWIDGTDTKFSNWATNQPDNMYGGEHHVQIGGPGIGGHWHDEKGARSVSGICKIEFTRLRKYSPARYPCDYGFSFWTNCWVPVCGSIVMQFPQWGTRCDTYYHPQSYWLRNTSCTDQTDFIIRKRWTPILTMSPPFNVPPLSLAVCLAPVLFTSQASSSCPQGWIAKDFCGGSACYKTYLLAQDWGLPEVRKALSTNTYCAKFNPKANLASIHCRKEDNFMQRFSYSFIGLFLPSTGNPTKWVDGTPFDYNGFDNGTLTSRSSNQEFVSINPGKGWGAYSEHIADQIVCKIVLRPYTSPWL